LQFVLSINPNKAQPKFRSGGSLLHRELSSGRQEYDTDRNLWPVNQPIPKVGAIYQTSGEAEYINDLIIRDNEVFCALTIASIPGMIEKIDFQEALVNHFLLTF
jgi:xanthine dehydrogenase/oxidase